jgi:DNA-binding LacI/PurR family transcriptional regulator
MTSGKSSKRSTIYDVARAAGVSYQTVSRVINDSPHVSSKTRSLVMQVIQELDYRPNKSAQVLNTQRSNLIEVIALDLSTGAPAIDTLSYTARNLGYKMMISAVHEEDLEATLNDAFGRSVDGFIFISSNNRVSSTEFQHLSHNIPFVRMIAEFGSNVPSVVYDQRLGAQLAARHIIGLGHRQIAEICGPPMTLDSLARHEGLLIALRDFGLKLGPSVGGDFSIESGYMAAEQLLDSGEAFTAVVVSNDAMALGAIHALRSRGLRVPDDISVIGFDDSNFSAYVDPPLTTVRQDFQLMAKVATEYLVSLIEKPDETPLYQQVLAPQLIIRHSTRRIG